jgi:DNA polymerase III epsilon subunit-like protein
VTGLAKALPCETQQVCYLLRQPSISPIRSYVEHNTLDDLCSRYGVDRSRRTQHGAPLDAELLAAVYVKLTTTRQAALQLEPVARAPASVHAIVKARPQPLPPRVTADDRNAHRAFVRTLGSEAIWLAWISTEEEFPNIQNAKRFTRLGNFAVAVGQLVR